MPHPFLTPLPAPPERRGETAEKGEDWPVWANALLDRVRRSFSVSRAAEDVGVGRATVYRLRQRDEAFALALSDAREESLDLIEEMLHKAGTTGLPVVVETTKTLKDGTQETTVKRGFEFHPTAAMFMLKRWRPEYRESFHVEQTGAGGGPIKVEVERTPTRERMLELAAIARELEVGEDPLPPPADPDE